MKWMILTISFSVMLVLILLISNSSDKIKEKIIAKKAELETKESETKKSKIHQIKRGCYWVIYNLLIIIGLFLSLLIALPFNYGGIVQEKYDNFVNHLNIDMSNSKVEETTTAIVQNVKNFGNKLLQAQGIQKSDTNIEDNRIEPLKEFPFSIKYDITFPETQVFEIPIWKESEEYTVTVPIELCEYQCEKVPKNEDIHGFIVNDTYYCDDDSETSIAEYNYYNFADYWLVLHTVEISFKGNEDFISSIDGATIMLKEKESQKAVIIEDGYLADSFVAFKCSTGRYIIEICKNGIVYKSNIFIDESERMFIDITEKNQYYLAFY